MAEPIRSSWSGLKDRLFVRVGVAYVVAAIAVGGAAELFIGNLGPASALQVVLVALLIGLPFALIGAWIYEVRRVRAGHTHGHVEAASRSDTGRSASGTVDTGKSIAVLPFVSMSSDPEQEYFSDGISEELLNLLTGIPELRVVSRSSAFAFKGHRLSAAEVASRLNVDHILDGSVRRAGDRVRIRAHLVEASSDSELWSETFDRALDDIFAIQDEIAAAVVEKLRVTLMARERAHPEIAPGAYARFLQARHLSNHLTLDSLDHSNELYEQVIELAPDYAPAWTGLAMNHTKKRWFAGIDVRESYQLAREAIKRGLELDPSDASAYSAQGTIAMAYDRDFAAAARHYAHALELEPSNYDILSEAGWFLGMLGRTEEGIEVFRHLSEREPLNAYAHAFRAWLHVAAGQGREGVAAARTALRLSPELADANAALGFSKQLCGETEAAREAMQAEMNRHVGLWGLIALDHELGRSSESDAALETLVNEYGGTNPIFVAMSYASRGDMEHALDWLETADRYGDAIFYEVVFLRWVFAAVQEDPRWLAMLERNAMASEQLAAVEFTVPLGA